MSDTRTADARLGDIRERRTRRMGRLRQGGVPKYARHPARSDQHGAGGR